MNKIKVDGHINLMRDPNTKAVINTDRYEYENYVNLRESKELENQKINSIESEVNSIKNDLNEIKNLLKGIINGSK
jgi:hypothetical protein